MRALLGPDGPFTDSEYLKTRLGSSFFLALSKADPGAGLGYLQRTVAAWDLDTRLSFTEGRRDVIYALQCIAIWRDLFCGAARLLLALAEAENGVGRIMQVVCSPICSLLVRARLRRQRPRRRRAFPFSRRRCYQHLRSDERLVSEHVIERLKRASSFEQVAQSTKAINSAPKLASGNVWRMV